MKKKDDFQAQRDVIKSLSEGGPGSTRWGNRTPKTPDEKFSQGNRILTKLFDKKERIQQLDIPARLRDRKSAEKVVATLDKRIKRAEKAVAMSGKIPPWGQGETIFSKEGLTAKARANSLKRFGYGGAAARAKLLPSMKAMKNLDVKKWVRPRTHTK